MISFTMKLTNPTGPGVPRARFHDETRQPGISREAAWIELLLSDFAMVDKNFSTLSVLDIEVVFNV